MKTTAMNEQTRIRLGIITARYGARLEGAARAAEAEAAERRAVFLRDFDRIREAVLRPAMLDIGNELADSAGHQYEIVVDSAEKLPSVALHLLLRGARADAKNVVRIFVSGRKDRGDEVIADVAVVGRPVELTRFQRTEALTREVVEYMLVDAVEQIFAGNAS
jgi:hypothetical protein